jgi:hypothetical protein
MQEQPLWSVTICGDAAMRAVVRMGGGVQDPLSSKNPLPPGEGRVRAVPGGSDHPAFARLNPHPDPLPEGEGELQRAGGKVVAVFARSFYLADASGGLACLGPPGLGRGPLNMLCDLPRDLDWLGRGLRPGIGARHAGDILTLDGIGAFALADATAWRPPSPPATWNAETLAKGLAGLALCAATATATRDDGFVPLVAPIARGRMEEVAATSPLLRLAAPGVAALAEWLVGCGDAAPDEAASMLIGLGPGLTPSGDDLLGGAMIALRALGRDDRARRVADWALPLAATRTGAISAAHLACAAAGEGNASLHEFLAALLMGDDAGIASAVAALAAIGHSSGWDMLAGVALACAAFSA